MVGSKRMSRSHHSRLLLQLPPHRRSQRLSRPCKHNHRPTSNLPPPRPCRPMRARCGPPSPHSRCIPSEMPSLSLPSNQRVALKNLRRQPLLRRHQNPCSSSSNSRLRNNRQHNSRSRNNSSSSRRNSRRNSSRHSNNSRHSNRSSSSSNRHSSGHRHGLTPTKSMHDSSHSPRNTGSEPSCS